MTRASQTQHIYCQIDGQSFAPWPILVLYGDRVDDEPAAGLIATARQRLWTLRSRQRERQPGDQPDGTVPEPGDPRAGRLLAAYVSSFMGIDAHSGEYRRPLHAARLSFAGALR